MKKTLLVLYPLLSFTLFSCASKTVPSPSTVPEEIQENVPEVIPELSDNTSQTEVPSVENNQENTENIIEEQSDSSTTIEQEESAEEVTEQNVEILSQELEEIVEPEVITLEPEVEVVEDTPEVEELPLPEEIIEEELSDLPVEVSIIASADVVTPVNQTSAENENAVSEVDEVIVVTDEVNNVSDEVAVITNEDAIDITNDDETTQQEENQIDLDAVIEPSRKVTLKRLEYLDIAYPGSGWIYMGVTDGSKDIIYFGRKVGTENTKFSVQAKNAGTKILHFYKNDSVTGIFIDDYIEVEILSEKGSNKTHIEAPEYKTPVPKKPVEVKKELENTVENSTVTEEKSVAEKPVVEKSVAEKPFEEKSVTEKPVIENPSTEKQISTPESVIEQKTEVITPAADEVTQEKSQIDTAAILKEVKTLVAEKKYVQAKEKISIFFEYSTGKLDEALYLQGQIFEAKSEVQDIAQAIESYTTLTKNYPASKYWDDANKRIIYLKRFYLEGR